MKQSSRVTAGDNAGAGEDEGERGYCLTEEQTLQLWKQIQQVCK